MSPVIPPATVPRRRWPMFVLCLAVLAGLATVVVVKSCPPTPAPAGRPADDPIPWSWRSHLPPPDAAPPVVVAPALPAPVLPAPAAPVDVKAGPK